jgi:hypothetical protein
MYLMDNVPQLYPKMVDFVVISCYIPSVKAMAGCGWRIPDPPALRIARVLLGRL